ncbi:hypothetical protein [Sphingomonas sp. HMP6]|uniref:hypothetical protein n=1 Tax=Sphingomonas sp. HMP6 TaxID=1517551 RepID=UPI00159660B3|nr:hypothetical protein [Sphingomonas sp. HMP6]
MWFASGALMRFLSIDKGHGDHLVDRKTVVAVPRSVALANIDSVVPNVDDDVESATVRGVLGRPVFDVATKSGMKLFDGSIGSAVPFVTAAPANTSLTQPGSALASPAQQPNGLRPRAQKCRGVLPAIRVNFTDAGPTRVFAIDTGRIAAVRTPRAVGLLSRRLALDSE